MLQSTRGINNPRFQLILIQRSFCPFALYFANLFLNQFKQHFQLFSYLIQLARQLKLIIRLTVNPRGTTTLFTSNFTT